MAQSLFMTLKGVDPETSIDVLAPGWSLPLLARMPEVRQGLVMPLGHGQLGLRSRWRLGRSLSDPNYDQAIVLPRSFKSALVPWFARIPKRTGYRGEMRFGLINDLRILDSQRLPMTVQRFVALGLPKDAAQPPSTPMPRLRCDPANFERLRERFGLTRKRPSVALMPGAEYGPAKKWPVAHFAEAARSLIARGHQVWVLGSAKDRIIGDELSALVGEGLFNLCGQTDLTDAVDLLGFASAAITNDSGLMHVAAALDTPLVAIFGSSTPGHTPPMTTQAKTLHLGLECSPCFKRTCPLGHTRCLTDIQPEQVLAALRF